MRVSDETWEKLKTLNLLDAGFYLFCAESYMCSGPIEFWRTVTCEFGENDSIEAFQCLIDNGLAEWVKGDDEDDPDIWKEYPDDCLFRILGIEREGQE